MNFDSRESLLRDGTFDAPRRDSFIRDEFAGPSRPTREGASGREPGLSEFHSESEWQAPKSAGLRLHRAEVVLAVAVIALIIGGVSVWALLSNRGEVVAPPPAVESAASVPQTPVAVERTTPEASPPVPAKTAGRPQPATRQAAAAVPRPTPSAGQAGPPVGRDAATRPATPPQPQANILTPTLIADTQVATPSTAGVRVEAARVTDAGGLNRVYSSADEDVIPPKMIIEDVPAALIVGMPRRMQSVELMVTEGGDVSRVRLLTEQRRILDTMLLSRAKMWRFTPALRQGRPVPYRLVVLWEVND